MGNSSYSVENRTIRAATASYHTKAPDEIFTQNKIRKIHDSMRPKGIHLREARDSSTHPHTVPIILALDDTGSMRTIPHALVKDGLPHMMGKIIQSGIPDPALLFLAIGDHECDQYPLQVGQFESGDEELDTWLTRTYLEGNGGGNEGESYLLAWYFAAFHTVTDAWEKRKEKGFLFTVGDEPSLDKLPRNVIESLMGSAPQTAFTAADLLVEAQKKWNVFHLHILQGAAGTRSHGYWRQMLGQNCIAVSDYNDVAKIIADIVVRHAPKTAPATVVSEPVANPVNPVINKPHEEEML